MSKDDWETGKTLMNPYIEIGKGLGLESNPVLHVEVNVSTFGEIGLGKLLERTEVRNLSCNVYSVYGVVRRTIIGGGRAWGYLNIDDPPISRTLMGFLSDEDLKKVLPNVHHQLNPKE